MMSAMDYPVTVSVEPLLTNRNRLTTAFRLILAIPHMFLVGGSASVRSTAGTDKKTSVGSETGLLGAVVWFLAIVSWFTIVFTGQHVAGIRQYTGFYLRWRVRALSYLMLLQDEYPPFGDGPYPASLDIDDPAGPRSGDGRLPADSRNPPFHHRCVSGCGVVGHDDDRVVADPVTAPNTRRACTDSVSPRCAGCSASKPTCF